jgi:hypothetical protein
MVETVKAPSISFFRPMTFRRLHGKHIYNPESRPASNSIKNHHLSVTYSDAIWAYGMLQRR